MQEIFLNDYFKPGSGNLLKRENDINTLLLQLSVKVNWLIQWVNEQENKKKQYNTSGLTVNKGENNA